MSEPTKLPNSDKEQRGPDASRTSEQQTAEREQHLDKTIADSFPSSDPPSTIPNPA